MNGTQKLEVTGHLLGDSDGMRTVGRFVKQRRLIIQACVGGVVRQSCVSLGPFCASCRVSTGVQATVRERGIPSRSHLGASCFMDSKNSRSAFVKSRLICCDQSLPRDFQCRKRHRVECHPLKLIGEHSLHALSIWVEQLAHRAVVTCKEDNERAANLGGVSGEMKMH